MSQSWAKRTWGAMTRTKTFTEEEKTATKLNRTLNLMDLTGIGVGSTLGAGVYVLSGEVGRESSGPAVILAFTIAAFSSILSGMCYAEFGARVPKAGSGYIYSYVTMGEFCALTIGWNLVLSYVVGTSSVAKAWSANFDSMIGCQVRAWTVNNLPSMNSPYLEQYPDAFAASIIILLSLLMCYGVQEVALVNKVFTFVNIAVLVFVSISGMIKADFHNWNLTPEEVAEMVIARQESGNATVQCGDINATNVDWFYANGGKSLVDPDLDFNVTTSGDMATNLTDLANAMVLTEDEYPGVGGFLPYGFSGVIAGTATCFYAFVGFDAIATTGEEAINPQKNIPISIVLSLIVCCVAYLGISAALTLMVPYFLLDKQAPLPDAFNYVGMSWASYLVGIGATCALTTSLLGAMFPMPRVIYAMAEDGILFRFLAKVHEKTKTPVIATAVSGALAAVLAMVFNLKELVDFMSIGTLMAYTLVAASVMVLRYRSDPKYDTQGDDCDESFTWSHMLFPVKPHPTTASSRVVAINSYILTVACIAFGAIGVTEQYHRFNNIVWVFWCISAFTIVAVCISIYRQPESSAPLDFKVPLIPFVPAVNILVNVYLMVSLEPKIWAKLMIWLAAGYAIYFFYGTTNSSEHKKSMAYLAGEMTDNANGKVHMDSKMDAELVVDDKKLES